MIPKQVVKGKEHWERWERGAQRAEKGMQSQACVPALQGRSVPKTRTRRQAGKEYS